MRFCGKAFAIPSSLERCCGRENGSITERCATWGSPSALAPHWSLHYSRHLHQHASWLGALEQLRLQRLSHQMHHLTS